MTLLVIRNQVQKMPSMAPAIRTIAPHAVDLLPPTPRTKGDIIWYSGNDDPNIKVNLLPATVDGLLKRFNKLYKEFTQGRHEHELVALLDELLRQNGISREEYTRRNNVISKSLDAAADDDDGDIMHVDDDDDYAAAAADDDDDDDANDDDTAEYVIPETDEGLKERFNHLFIEFTRTKEHGSELNVLLGEMLNRGLVTPEEYKPHPQRRGDGRRRRRRRND